MELRRCTACAAPKPISEFHRRGTGYQTWCKACRKSHDAAYHAGRRSLRLAQKRERVEYLVAWMREVKSQPCTDCRCRFHPAAMTFDHLPGTMKRGDVADLIRGGCIGLARAELVKCEIVCANCHAIRTYLRREEARALLGAKYPTAIAELGAPYASSVVADRTAQRWSNPVFEGAR